MYAIIETGGKQYKVEPGDKVSCEKLGLDDGKKVTFDKVLVLADGNDVKVGKPYIDGATVEGKVIENGKGKKVIVFKYKAKKDSKSKQGHRQPYTLVEITKVGGKAKSSAKAKTEDKADAKKSAKKEEKKSADKNKPVNKTNDSKKASSSMKKDELIEYAKKNKIEIDPKAKKADILAAIQDAEK